VWPAAPSYPPSRSPNTSPKLRQNCAHGVLLGFRPAAASFCHLICLHLAVTGAMAAMTSDYWGLVEPPTSQQRLVKSLTYPLKWSASFDWGHVEGKKTQKIQECLELKIPSEMFWYQKINGLEFPLLTV
jgi:hypothetical protein